MTRDYLPPRDVVAALLREGGEEAEFCVSSLPGGANNRAFRVDVADGEPLFLKAYFRHPNDPRDRLGTEYAFSRFAWNHGVHTLPEPLAADAAHSLGLYRYVEGRYLRPEEISHEHVLQCWRFVEALAAHRATPEASTLPPASEACFSVEEHLACVTRRLERLQGIEGTTAIDREAVGFVNTELIPAWQRLVTRVRQQASALGIEPDQPIAKEDRCLSPSDFGFHNALLTAMGELCFVDFEYAGWDDPAKLVGDFFCQVAVPVPLIYFEENATRVAALFRRTDWHRKRIDLLLPVYQVKWCCIVLNDFLPTAAARRRFAFGGESETARKVLQLSKARAGLERLAAIRDRVRVL